MSSGLSDYFGKKALGKDTLDAPPLTLDLSSAMINTRDVTLDGEFDGQASAVLGLPRDISYLRPKGVVEEEKRIIARNEARGNHLAVKSGVDEFVTKGIEHLEYAAMIAYEGNHYEELERITDRLDDLCEEYGIEQSDTYDAHITTPAP